MSKLQIGPDLVLPVDAVTQTIGILAKRRVGKSYTARRFAEQFYKAGQQIVIVDPKGDWWGIRSSADGKSPGLSVVILGGERGDVPLEVGGGEIVAKLVVEERVSVLIDLSLFRKHEVATFMTAFLENLYRLKAKETNRTPLMLIMDEADATMPQKPQPNEARMLGAGEDIVRRGGQRGIGCMLITQRSAVLNKNVLTQCEMIVALRTIAPQDLKALDAWIEVHGEPGQRETLMTSLPALPVGDAWFWSPGWPTATGIFKRVHVSPIETFDSGASPKAGEKRAEPKNVADVDLGALTKRMADTIERAKADDPKELRKQLAERDKMIRQMQKGAPVEKIVTKPVRDDAAIDRAVAAAVAAERKKFKPVLVRLQRLATTLTEIPAAIGELAQLADTPAPATASLRPFPAGTAATVMRPPARVAPSPRAPTSKVPVEGVTPSMQRVLNALGALEQLGIAPAERIQVAIFAGYTENGHFNNMLGELRTAGLLDYPAGGTAQLTDAGRAIADAGKAMTSLTELHERWLSKLSPSEAKLARVLIDAHPEPMTRADLAQRTGYTENGHFNNMCGKLRTMGLAAYPAGGQIVAADVLFPEGLA